MRVTVAIATLVLLLGLAAVAHGTRPDAGEPTDTAAAWPLLAEEVLPLPPALLNRVHCHLRSVRAQPEAAR